jgi:hypothetical protein
MIMLGRLLGVIVFKDLLVNDVPGSVLRFPGAFTMPFFSFLSPPAVSGFNDDLAFVALVIGALSALLLAAGVAMRLAAFVLFLLYGIACALDELVYTNNVFLLILLLALFIAEPYPPGRRAALYPRRLVQLLVTVMYVTSAAAKLTPVWISGSILRSALFYYQDTYSRFVGWDAPVLFRVGALASIAVELTLAVGLWLPRSRPWAIALGVAFHATIEVLMPVRMFGYLAVATYVAFLPDATLARTPPLLRTPGRAVVVAIGFALAVDLITTKVLRVGVLGQRTMLACAIASGLCALVLLSRTRLRSQLADRIRLPRRARAACVVAFVALQAFLVTKPLYGFTNRFGWKMFTEELQLRAECEVLEGGHWVTAPIDAPWSSARARRYWSSFGEQKNLLAGYARFRVERDPVHRPVCIRLFYRLNGADERTDEVCAPSDQPRGAYH